MNHSTDHRLDAAAQRLDASLSTLLALIGATIDTGDEDPASQFRSALEDALQQPEGPAILGQSAGILADGQGALNAVADLGLQDPDTSA